MSLHYDPIPATEGFNQEKFYILDGGTGANLAMRFPELTSKDKWWGCGLNLTSPEAVGTSHREFLEAGATIITANTYQIGPEMIEENPDVVEKAVKIAWEAIEKVRGCPRINLVAGSVGPYGACLGDGSEYTGNYLVRRFPVKSHLKMSSNLSYSLIQGFYEY